ncbi:MAG: ATP-binding protein [Candidatus Aminicenantes bacterium]|nr:ATP-binding protein [Candidatus Aminicenantes bacterium]
MFFKSFRIQVILRIVLIALSIYALLYLALQTQLYATILVALLFIVFQVFALIRYVEKTNRDLNRFFLAIEHEDFSRTFSGRELGASFAELITAFNEVQKKFQQTRAEKEEHYRYLQTIVHHVGIGLITFKTDGKVDMINTAARKLLKVAHLNNIKALESFSKPLVEQLFSLRPGEKALVKIETQEMELVIRAAEFRMHEQKFTLISLQNIQSELQEKELEAWQKLIRVLTHEIMNSMTPITSMSSTVIDLLQTLLPGNENGHTLVPQNPVSSVKGTPAPQADIQPGCAEETLADIAAALKTIHKRSRGLSQFVGAYRNLTLIPRPVFKIFSIEELFIRVEQLMESKLKERGIALRWQVDPQSLELTADPGLIEQVMINLFLNATAASKGKKEPQIELSAGLNESGRVVIDIKDNGSGIVKEALNKIFIPFFTTRKKGSGIGLSLSRQIMKLHRGSISVNSIPDKETVFTLKF